MDKLESRCFDHQLETITRIAAEGPANVSEFVIIFHELLNNRELMEEAKSLLNEEEQSQLNQIIEKENEYFELAVLIFKQTFPESSDDSTLLKKLRSEFDIVNKSIAAIFILNREFEPDIELDDASGINNSWPSIRTKLVQGNPDGLFKFSTKYQKGATEIISSTQQKTDKNLSN